MEKVESDLAASKERRMWLGLDLDGWNKVIVGALAISAIAAVIVGISTFVVVQLQKQEAMESENELIRYKMSVAAQVSEAHKSGIDAGKIAGDATVRAAQANERAARLEKEAESLRQENLKLQIGLAPRMLTASQISAFKSLKGKISQLNICFETDGESGQFATQIAVALQQVGIKVLLYERSARIHSGNNELYDLLAFENPNGKPTGGEPLLNVMKKAGLFEYGTVVTARLPIDVIAPPDIPMIFIGGKPWIAPVSPYVSPGTVK